jgi:conjugative transfer region protein TrbK
MDGKFFARIGAGVFVAIAITATAVEMTRDEAPIVRPTVTPSAEREVDPLRAELVRCQELGEAGPRDHDCLKVWAENRRRFLAPGARPSGLIQAPGTDRKSKAGTEAPAP